ncbi:MAG: LPXTG cell wall anchor domain-containing protein [Blautia sp.]
MTGEDGTAKSEELPIAVYEEGKYVEPIVYVLVETKPLEGYEANTEEVEVVFDYQDDETKIIEVTKEIENTRKPGTPPPDAPKTGDHTKIWIPVIIMAAAILGIVVIVIRIRRRRR